MWVFRALGCGCFSLPFCLPGPLTAPQEVGQPEPLCLASPDALSALCCFLALALDTVVFLARTWPCAAEQCLPWPWMRLPEFSPRPHGERQGNQKTLKYLKPRVFHENYLHARKCDVYK